MTESSAGPMRHQFPVSLDTASIFFVMT